jgi:hypothetical protein
MGQSDKSSRHNLWTLPLDPGTPGAMRTAVPMLHLAVRHNARAILSRPAQCSALVAYTSNESGQSQIYVHSFPGGAGKFQISTSGGALPRWRRNRTQI